MASGVTSTPASRSSPTKVTRKFSTSWPSSTSIRSRRSQAHSRRLMALRRTQFRSFPSSMTKTPPSVSRRLFAVAATIATVSSGALAQTPGQPPLFDPQGQVEGPINTLDVRGRVQQNLLDFGALGRLRSAQALARSSSADADATAEQAANIATNAYVRAMRADADLRARQADTVLATELLSIAQSQLQAGTGVGLDVTRAKSQLANTRAALIASRNARDHAHLDLLRALALPVGTEIVLTDSLSPATDGEPLPDEAALVAQAIRNRPDLLAEDERIRAAKQGLSAIKAERLPSLGLVADDGVIGKNGAKLLNTYTWGLQVTLPISTASSGKRGFRNS